MKFEEFATKNLKWSPEEIRSRQAAMSHIAFKSEDDYIARIEFLKTTFSLSKNSVNRLLKIMPTLIGLSNELILKKSQFLMSLFDFSQNNLNAIIKKQPQILVLSENAVIDKKNFYQNTLQLDPLELANCIKKFPNLLSFSENTIESKILFFNQAFNLTTSEFVKIFTIQPSIISYAEDAIIKKANFYKTLFNLSNDDFKSILLTLPALLGYSEQSIIDKIVFYNREFGITRDEMSEIFKACPSFMSYSSESILAKKSQLNKINITKQDILNQPTIMTVPANTIVLRYMLLRLIASREEILKKNGWFIQTAHKTYARLAGLADEQNIKLSHIVADEEKFKKRFNMSSNDLMKEYPLTEQALYEIEQLYNALIDNNLKLTLSSDEINAVLGD